MFVCLSFSLVTPRRCPRHLPSAEFSKSSSSSSHWTPYFIGLWKEYWHKACFLSPHLASFSWSLAFFCPKWGAKYEGHPSHHPDLLKYIYLKPGNLICEQGHLLQFPTFSFQTLCNTYLSRLLKMEGYTLSHYRNFWKALPLIHYV